MTERMPWMYRFMQWLVPRVNRAMGWHITVANDDRLPLDGAVVVANHISYYDPVVLADVLDRRPRVIRFLAKRELFDGRVTGPIVRGAMQIPVDRRGDRRASLRPAEEALRQGHTVVVFPEGTIHAALDAANVKTGAARLALATGRPLVPVALCGTQTIRRNRFGLPRQPTSIIVRFGDPVPFDPEETSAAVTARMVEAMRRLIDEASEGHDPRPPIHS